MSSKFDPQAPDHGYKGDASGSHVDEDLGQDSMPSDGDLLAVVAQADRLSKDYQARTIERPLSRSYRAWQNTHAEGSKYLGTAWRGRSRLFVPKTRTAVRKNLANTAASLFSTDDVVNIKAMFEDDETQRATAATIKADLDYRLTGTSNKHGVPWFQTALGACLDSQLTGVCISKQFWEYDEVDTGEVEIVSEPLMDEMGIPIPDESGYPIMVETEVPLPPKVTKDRPMCELHPIENAGLDPAAPWYSPAQLGRWFFMRHPMGISDIRKMLETKNKDGETIWLDDVSDGLLDKGRIEEDRAGSRRVREGGSDRFQDAKTTGPMDIVWIQENFVRLNGEDYHFWSVGRHGMISKVQTTREAYPHLDGERPYTFGVSQLDTHRVFPMSPVESWQPLQLELNDVANLRLDTLKRSIAPLPVVRRGRNVDLTQLQRRGQPDAILLADSLDDIKFEMTPGPSGQSYTETSVNNANFDELAGVFSTSSVQQSRQLNETVGGMKMMSGAASSVSEFDLRVFIETWAEPTLRQFVHLIRYYESDEHMLAVAGSKAQVIRRFNYFPTLNDFDAAEVMLRVNVGIGANDPMQRLTKLKFAIEMLAPMFGEMRAQGIKPDIETLIEEVMGSAGYKDGRRFFEFGEPQEPPPDPDIVQTMERLKLERERMMHEFKEAMLELRSEESRNTQDNQTKLALEQMRLGRDEQKQTRAIAFDREQHAADREQTSKHKVVDLMANQHAQRATQSAGKDGEKDGNAALKKQVTDLDKRFSTVEAAIVQIAQHLAAQQPQPQFGNV